MTYLTAGAESVRAGGRPDEKEERGQGGHGLSDQDPQTGGVYEKYKFNDMINQSIDVLTNPGIATFEKYEKGGTTQQALIYVAAGAIIVGVLSLVGNLIWQGFGSAIGSLHQRRTLHRHRLRGLRILDPRHRQDAGRHRGPRTRSSTRPGSSRFLCRRSPGCSAQSST